MRRFGHCLTTATAMLLAFAASAQTEPPVAPAAIAPLPPGALRFDRAAMPDPARVLALVNHSAAAQMALLKARPLYVGQRGPGPRNMGAINTNWISATFLIGLQRLARVSDETGARQYLRDVAEHYNFGLLGAWSTHNMLDADNIAIGDVYQELYARSGEAGEIAPLRARLDFGLPSLQADPAPAKLVWWWCDALFMAPPVYARMAALTHDHSYLQAMDVQWWRVYDRLWSAEHNLFYRDERFVTRKTASGKPVFWGRGNGWVVAGLARLLDTMPANYQTRPRYVEVFQKMMASIARLQRGDGLWTASLLDPNDPPGGETTASAFFTYAMAWGINHGILDRAAYLPRVQRGWAALAERIQPNGLLGFAQRTGDQPEPSRATDHALYGTGGLLLAGVEVMNLGKPVSALPIAEPQRDPPGPVRMPIALRPRPENGDPAAIKSWERGMAERQAMIDLAYNPSQQQAPADAPAARADGIVMPKITLPLTPPADRSARASIKFAPYRFDDLLWENDRTAHRIYGPALEKEEPPSTSGIDAWGKNVAWPFMERQLRTGKQHDYHGDGIDFYNVGTTRGAGGLGIWANNKLWASRNWAKYRILKDGPDVADFEVDYAPWPVDTARKAWETRRFTLPLGTNFTRMVSTIGSDQPGEMLVGIGIQKKPTVTPGQGVFTADRANGRFSFWTPEDPDKGAMGVGVLVDPAMIADVVQDADNYIILLRVTPGKPFVYYTGGAWSKGLHFHDRAAWEAYVAGVKADFVARRD
ncbi:glycoside hydrolase family 88 protein [Sphingomonas sp.]|uniref:glycoside hydrolase family 88 protein n=1 Tax=Sphingomonas sp. TaxID=28214 RepID=UPI002ED838E3